MFVHDQHVAIHSLQARSDLNGTIARVTGPVLASGRYPVKLLQGGESVCVKPSNLARTDGSPEEGKCEDGRVMVFGEWFPMQALLDKMMNNGSLAGGAFSTLEKRKQADVLAGREALDVPIDPSLPDGCPRREWLGSGGMQCDGCGMSRNELWRNTWAGAEAAEDEEAPSDAELEVDICERCRYTACEDCAVHHSRGTCFCKGANFGDAYPPEGSEEREWYHRGYW
tara:strand:+ start:1431 stop:2108 length:678 start_codon:yes stop_codon:yes gene_type:complete